MSVWKDSIKSRAAPELPDAPIPADHVSQHYAQLKAGWQSNGAAHSGFGPEAIPPDPAGRGHMATTATGASTMLHPQVLLAKVCFVPLPEQADTFSWLRTDLKATLPMRCFFLFSNLQTSEEICSRGVWTCILYLMTTDGILWLRCCEHCNTAYRASDIQGLRGEKSLT